MLTDVDVPNQSLFDDGFIILQKKMLEQLRIELRTLGTYVANSNHAAILPIAKSKKNLYTKIDISRQIQIPFTVCTFAIVHLLF